MILSRYTIKNITTPDLVLPDAAVFELPEKVLQFGTGVLLRGLPDYFIDQANRMGKFNGRVVIVKSTAHGDRHEFARQDGLYTLCIRGVEGDKKVEETIMNASISRVLHASDEWAEVLACAHNTHMQVIISNTTEVGIQLVNEDIRRHPPVSYPAKLLAFLYERFQAFGGSSHSGMIIIPTELITDNGKELERIVLELAHLNGLEDSFIEWLERHNRFCNSLVDRIVPGKPEAAILEQITARLGYADRLLTFCESYKLWAIEGDDFVRSVLDFGVEGMIVAHDINRFRELKLRLLNGTHTLSCGLAFLAGFHTVKEAMDHAAMEAFISSLMLEELSPAIPYPLQEGEAEAFGKKVLDRFRNGDIRHYWLSITLNYSSKMKMRNVPMLMRHFASVKGVPECFTLGFAAYLLFMKAVTKKGEEYFGSSNGEEYLIQDEQAPVFYRRWRSGNEIQVVSETLRDSAFWGEDLHLLPGFEEGVNECLARLQAIGARETLIEAMARKEVMA